jgi:Archaeal/vacuolar-type H+-ATPase subunit E
MSLETVVEDIREEARARADEVTSEADEEAEKLLEEARADAEEIRAEREQEVERTIEQEREQKLSSTKLEAKQDRLEARRDVLQEVREDVESTIADLEEGREELTRTLLEDAAAEFDDSASVEVYGRADDEALLRSLLEEYDGFEYGGEYDCLGGVVAESEASRVRVKNTFDSLLDGVWEGNIRSVSQQLFEDQ